MDETNRTNTTSSSSPSRENRAYVPYQRNTPHITQAPITDDNVSYQPRARDMRPDTAQQYTGQQASSSGRRKHMGVATSDPQYLQPTGRAADTRQGPAHPRHKNPGDGEPQVLHYDRYLSTPSSRKTIFTARQDRSRKRVKALLVIALIAVIAIVVWIVFFH